MSFRRFLSQSVVLTGVVFMLSFFFSGRLSYGPIWMAILGASIAFLLNHVICFLLATRSLGSNQANSFVGVIYISFFLKLFLSAGILFYIRWNFPYASHKFVIWLVVILAAHLIYQPIFLSRINDYYTKKG